MFEQIVMPFLYAGGGFLAANWKSIIRWKRDNDNELVTAVKNAREDILRLYKIIDEMEALNSNLKVENVTLKLERDKFKELAETARQELDRLTAYIAELEPSVSKKKRNEGSKN